MLPEDLINEDSDGYTWCNYVIELVKGDSEDLGDTIEYLLSIRNTMESVYNCVLLDFNEMEYYTLMQDFNDIERHVIIVLCYIYYDVDIRSIANFEEIFKRIDAEIHGKPEELDKQSPSEARSFSGEFIEISVISDEYFISFKSIISSIPISLKINDPAELYGLLRSTIWKNGIPCEIIEKSIILYLEEKYKSQKKLRDEEILNDINLILSSIQPYSHNVPKIDSLLLNFQSGPDARSPGG